MDDFSDVPSFVTKVRKNNVSFEITLDSKVCQYEGIEVGDFVKVFVRKLQKKV